MESERVNKMEKVIIVACAENRVIGKDGDIPWHYPEDLKYFKEKTTGHSVVMGRKTFDSLPSDYKPLPNRLNIVLTRSPEKIDNSHENVEVVENLDRAWEVAENNDGRVFVAGGGSVYEQTIEKVDKVLITVIKENFDGDTYFPELGDNWSESIVRETDALIFKEFSRN